jgi:hypothetical protein
MYQVKKSNKLTRTEKPKKVTFYIKKPKLIKKLKLLALNTETDLSSLATLALEEFINRYNKSKDKLKY